MVKVRGKGEHRVEALRLADAFRARVIDASIESFIFEITGASTKIDQFVNLMLPLGLVEVSRTGGRGGFRAARRGCKPAPAARACPGGAMNLEARPQNKRPQGPKE
jgi:hypothetical protein